MKNITVSLDEETHRLVRIRAAELNTSVSALVRRFLRSPVGVQDEGEGTETRAEHRRRLLEQVFADFDARGVGLRMVDNFFREELYDRARTTGEAQTRPAPKYEALEHG